MGNEKSQHPDSNQTWEPGRINHLRSNHHLSDNASTAMIAEANCDDEMSLDDGKLRTELDYHAKMVVIGRHMLIVNNTGWMAEVSPFTPDCEVLHQVPNS